VHARTVAVRIRSRDSKASSPNVSPVSSRPNGTGPSTPAAKTSAWPAAMTYTPSPGEPSAMTVAPASKHGCRCAGRHRQRRPPQPPAPVRAAGRTRASR
jgi:hypothetical protein